MAKTVWKSEKVRHSNVASLPTIARLTQVEGVTATANQLARLEGLGRLCYWPHHQIYGCWLVYVQPEGVYGLIQAKG